MSSRLPPLSLYIHTPWCVRKCPYCDFNSHESAVDLPETAYLEALLRDFELELPALQGRTIASIFIGGGTPSLLSGDFYQRLLSAIAARATLATDVEITLEANPGTTEAQRFEAYRGAGINRLSLGVQSFSVQQLAVLGRIHGAAEARQAVRQAQAAGFSNINIDLMHGLPGQTAEMAVADLHEAIALGPMHLSWYQLTIEANTAFYSAPPPLPEDETLWQIQEAGQACLANAGYVQYEVSAYARAKQFAQHNRNYWRFGDYIGIGAGAHGKITNWAEDGRPMITRYRKTRMPEHYLKPMLTYRIGVQQIAPEDLPFEFMMNALRLNEGVSECLFTERTGLPLNQIAEPLQVLRSQGLMEPDRLAATAQGRLFLNTVLEAFA